jgi:hypothetical protein
LKTGGEEEEGWAEKHQGALFLTLIFTLTYYYLVALVLTYIY